MRLFTHYEFRFATTGPRGGSRTRSVAGQPVSARRTFATDDAWARRWYEPGTAREKERRLFAGT